MILSEASEKYGIPLDRLSRAVSTAGTQPIGERQGKRKVLREYAEKEIVDAILADYKRKYIAQKKKADFWKIKASEVIFKYRKDRQMPIDDDD